MLDLFDFLMSSNVRTYDDVVEAARTAACRLSLSGVPRLNRRVKRGRTWKNHEKPFHTLFVALDSGLLPSPVYCLSSTVTEAKRSTESAPRYVDTVGR